ncbi:MAG: 30S ribosomal protein S20 [Flavobacteriaceae bacterium]|nr:30S ribosomal protein S20 [Flavobacteriaceae bacterium]MCY4266903.1 30S ribosomal protein S20 [Flavobacteriaceae bacterium]MCY4299325.1 30S ribosomal protein S20 [Flavobacteriaceae bacterium]
MANHQSALKRIRSSEKKRLQNRYQHKTVRNAIRDFKKLEDNKGVAKRFPEIISMIDKLAKNNVIHQNKAANLKSKVTKHLASIS